MKNSRIITDAALDVDAGWETDFEAAKVLAKASGKYLLVDFTGSDWCVWCSKLKNEVFGQDYFKTEAPKKFILVELDIPRAKGEMTPERIARNRKLSKQYGVRSYPTILLMDAEGIVFAKSGYRPGGPEKYIEYLNSMIKDKKAFDKAFDKLISQADKAKGLEKAKLLDKALKTAPISIRKCRTDLIKQIIDLDKDDKAGLKTKYEFISAMNELDDTRPPGESDPAEIKAFGVDCLARVVALEKKYGIDGTNRQRILSMKAKYTFYSDDLAGSKKILETAIAVDAESELARSMKHSLAFVNERLIAKRPKKKTD